MTLAICYRCGSQKFGAFVPCKACGFIPSNDYEMAYSLALTEHHLPKDVLAQIGERIKSGAESPKLDETSLNAMLSAVRSGELTRMLGRSARTSKGSAPATKPANSNSLENNMAPDYGLMILRSGLGGVLQSFYGVPLSHITLSAPGLYTSLINKLHAGVEYALSFDFGPIQAEALFAKLPPPMRANVISRLSRAKPGATIEFRAPLLVDLHARLGKLQKWQKEEFVPLLVERVE